MKKTQPIRNPDDIKKMKRYLSNNKRDLLFFVLGINTGIRGCDLLGLKIKDIKYCNVGDEIQIKEKKTNKINSIIVNKTIYNTFQEYIKEYTDKKDNDFIFTSQKGNGDKPIHIYSMSRIVSKWFQDMGFRGNYGIHSLRKTFGYIQRVKYGYGVEIICKKYNHSSPKTTMLYLGITDKEINTMCMNEI